METNLRTDKLLDQIGWKLLQELQINGRLSYAELGRRVGLTTPAVVERVKRMEEAGIIVGYHADIDPDESRDANHGLYPNVSSRRCFHADHGRSQEFA